LRWNGAFAAISCTSGRRSYGPRERLGRFEAAKPLAEYSEVERLRRELKRVSEERDISKKAAAHRIVPSMNGRKAPQDNAVAESFFSNLKNELIHHCD
jgi:transposase InsO family protein